VGSAGPDTWWVCSGWPGDAAGVEQHAQPVVFEVSEAMTAAVHGSACGRFLWTNGLCGFDHVVIGRAGVFAVETKWLAAPWWCRLRVAMCWKRPHTFTC
jgi:hypothetical protein